MEHQGQSGAQGQAGGPGQVQGQNINQALAQRQAQMALIMKQPPYSNFIKPEQFTMVNFGATNLTQSQLDQYKTGFTKLWDNVFKHPRDHPMHQQAVQKLGEASSKLFREYHRVKQEKALGQMEQTAQQGSGLSQEEQKDIKPGLGMNQTGTQQQNQGQIVQPQSGNQMTPVANGQPRAPELPAEIRAQAEKMTWTLPITLQEGTSEAQNWRSEANRRYGESLWKRTRSAQIIRECDEAIQLAKKNGTENVAANERKAQYQKHLDEATLFMNKLAAQEKINQEGRQKLRQGSLSQQQVQNAQNLPSQQNRQSINQTPTSAVRGGEIQQTRPSSSSATPAMGQTGFSQAAGQTGQQAPGFAGQRPPAQPLHTNQQIPMQNNTTQSPTPLSHSQAIAASSRSYSSQPQAAPQSANHFQQHRNSSSETDTRNISQPIQKHWAPQPPQPVATGPSRPTLSGVNNGPVGAMGQPAIQKPDTFLLQGPGDRVLDKKKLDELVRQVCGADAGEGDALLPEVEESVLQLADEFIDNVVTSACKLAKLRGATTLEIRDIQLVLERQYNIRVPGYATDEVRTVRKTQPAQGYYQKMNAIQAAKVMGGKPDA